MIKSKISPKKKAILAAPSQKRFWGRATRFEYQKTKGKIGKKKS